MSNLEQQLCTTLTRYLTKITVSALLRRAKERTGEITTSSLPAILKSLEPSLKLFLAEAPRLQLAAELGLLRERLEPGAKQISVRHEDDILSARNEAAQRCKQLGANSFAVQRAATAVSELARNIVNYTPGGTISIRPSAANALTIIAADEGKGIPNLEQILAGKYRSRSGMGMGLLGVKRISSAFEVATSEGGTSVRIELCW